MEHQGDLASVFFGHVLTFLFSSFKVTILEPGPFRTEIIQNNYNTVPQHPAYADPTLPASQRRKHFGSPQVFDGDVSKAVVVIEKLTQTEEAPLRFPLHRGVVSTMRDKAKKLSELADKYESWNEDLYHDD